MEHTAQSKREVQQFSHDISNEKAGGGETVPALVSKSVAGPAPARFKFSIDLVGAYLRKST